MSGYHHPSEVVRQAFYDKTRNFIIKIDAAGISINDVIYPGALCTKLAIYDAKTGGGGRYRYLVIALDNQSTCEPYDLSGFLSLNPFGSP